MSATPDRLSRLLLAAFLLVLGHRTSEAQEPLRVKRVVDEDTFELSDGRTVRLIGIDTPEKYMSSKLRKDAERSGRDVETVQALGKQASRKARSLASGKRVRLTFDPANAADDYKGTYGRVLAYVWVVDNNGDRRYMVNQRLVHSGYAHAYTRYPFKYSERFHELEREARQSERGLWEDELPSRKRADRAPSKSRELRFDPDGPDRDCSDFQTQRAAQRFFEAAGKNDPHRLDGDGNVRVCENLPGS